MKTTSIPDGVWPTMITPFLESGGIDYTALEKLVDWYVEGGVSGLFSVCQSSEMFLLSLRERLDLARACVKFAHGRVPVIASGHVADDPVDQVEEAKAMAETGVAAIVLIANRFARSHEGDELWKRNLGHFLEAFPGSPLLGLYECPWPYKRILTPELMKFCADSGRFGFLKDTSCSMDSIRAKIDIAKGSGFKLFNANAATLLDSLHAGGAGYSGVMTNFHADLYSWLCANLDTEAPLATELADFLGLASVIEYQLYPVNAMYALSLEGLPIHMASRRAEAARLNESMRIEVEQLMRLSKAWSSRLAGHGATVIKKGAKS
ncbi:MAG: dihydrodipicolinate synthase family protein [Spirochaetota bacterium]